MSGGFVGGHPAESENERYANRETALILPIVSGPSLLLLDEPLAAVDVPLRRRILPYLRRVRDELTVPIIYVSHDREEIDELADVVVNINGGRVVGVERV